MGGCSTHGTGWVVAACPGRHGPASRRGTAQVRQHLEVLDPTLFPKQVVDQVLPVRDDADDCCHLVGRRNMRHGSGEMLEHVRALVRSNAVYIENGYG